MKIFISHPPTIDNQKTVLSADIAAAATTAYVKNTQGLFGNKFLILGNIASEQTELVPVSSITNATTIALVSPGTVFAHQADTRVTLIDWDQIRVYKSTTGITGTYSLVSTLDIDIDAEGTTYEDATALTSYYYKFAPFNSITSVEGDLSDPISATGYVFYSQKTIIDRVLSVFGDRDARFISRDEITDAVNELYEIGQQEMTLASDRFNISHQDITLQAGVYEYSLNANFFIEKAVKCSTDGGVKFPFSLSNKQLDSTGKVVQSNIRYGYTITDSTIRIEDSEPNAGDVVRVYYIEAPQQLTSPTDTLVNPFRHASAMFVKWGLSYCYLKDKKLEDYKELRDEAMRMLNRQISFVKRLTSRHVQHIELVGGV